jgi:hypothetical protein
MTPQSHESHTAKGLQPCKHNLQGLKNAFTFVSLSHENETERRWPLRKLIENFCYPTAL